MLPIYYTTITCTEGSSFGFAKDELGEFDREVDLVDFENALRSNSFDPKFIGNGRETALMLQLIYHAS